MTSLFDSKLALGAAGLASVVIGALGVVWLQGRGAPAAENPPAPVAHSWDGPIGPGMLAASAREAQTPAFMAQVPRDAELVVDGGGHLVPDLALRSLLDSYLLKTKGPERKARADQLRSFLAGRLKQPALADAQRVVNDYLGYLDTEEQLLARERFEPPAPSGLTEAQVEHLLAWQQQRTQLRERLLGVAVSQAWYEAEDSTCRTALADWRRQRDVPATEETDSNEHRARRTRGAALEERRNYYAQSCASQIMDGLAGRG
jgi:hypothetical protein